jgi:CYTH domain-containing protein
MNLYNTIQKNNMKEEIENERKFLVDFDLFKKTEEYYNRTTIEMSQFYIAREANNIVRTRSESKTWTSRHLVPPINSVGRYKLYIKSFQEKLGTKEFHFNLNSTEFQKLKSTAVSFPVNKKRHIVVFNQQVFHVDEFTGRLHGLVVAEFEYETKKQSDSLIKPDWLGKEITEDKDYSNANLSNIESYKLWKVK